MDSEAAVYAQCDRKGMGFLSVAHRPTVIRYHSKVLRFRLEGTAVKWEELPGKTVAAEEAEKVKVSKSEEKYAPDSMARIPLDRRLTEQFYVCFNSKSERTCLISNFFLFRF